MADISDDEDYPAAVDNSAVLGNGGEADSDDEQPAAAEAAAETDGERAEPGEDNFDDDENVTMAESSQPPVDPKAIAERLAGPCVIAGEADARRNSVDADGGGAPAPRALDVPARVGPCIDSAIAQLPRVVLKTPKSWDWVKLDMKLAEHGVVHSGDDGKTPIEVEMSLLKRSGESRKQQQNTFLASAANGSRAIAQAIILPIESAAPPGAKPKKMMIVPVSITDVPPDDADDLEGAVTAMAIEPDVIKKMYNRDSIAARSLPSDFHPDLVDYVSFLKNDDFTTIAAAQPTWETVASKKANRKGKRSAAAPAPAAPAAAVVEPAPKKPKGDGQRTLSEFPSMNGGAKERPAAEAAEAAEAAAAPPQAPSAHQEAAGNGEALDETAHTPEGEGTSKVKKLLKRERFRVSNPEKLAHLPLQITFPPLPEGTERCLMVSMEYYKIVADDD